MSRADREMNFYVYAFSEDGKDKFDTKVCIGENVNSGKAFFYVYPDINKIYYKVSDGKYTSDNILYEIKPEEDNEINYEVKVEN